MSFVEIHINYKEEYSNLNNFVTDSGALHINHLCVKSESTSHSRSNSWKGQPSSDSNTLNSFSKHKNRRRKSSPKLTRNNSVSMPDFTTNRNSIPTTTTDLQLSPRNSFDNCSPCMVRSFKTNSKGDVVNIGSICKVPSSNSLRSSGSLNTSHRNSVDSSGRRSSGDSQRAGSIDSTASSIDETKTSRLLTADIPNICVTPSYFRTLVLGSAGVGKTSLVHLFTKTTDSHNEDEENWNSSSGQIVSVELDGSESTMEFIDGSEMDVALDSYQVDAYILMYSISEPASFGQAISLLLHLRLDLGSDRPVYLVANKTDLVRQRRVAASEAYRMTSSHDCHFIETSTALNVNVDKLLVGVLCSIRRQLTPLSSTDIAFHQRRKGGRLRRNSGPKERRGSNSSIGSSGSSMDKRKSLGLLGEESSFGNLVVPQASFSCLTPGFPAYSAGRNSTSSSFSESSQQPKSSSGALTAISNFIKQACRRQSKRRDAYAWADSPQNT